MAEKIIMMEDREYHVADLPPVTSMVELRERLAIFRDSALQTREKALKNGHLAMVGLFAERAVTLEEVLGWLP